MTATTASIPDRSDERLLTRPFVLLALGELAYLIADGMAIFLVPVHVTGPMGAGSAGAGLAFGAFAVSALVLRPVAGRLCDAHGRRPLLVGGAALAAAALLVTAQVETLAALVMLRLVAGVAEAAVFVAIFAAVADLAPPGRMGEAISYNSLALYTGLAAGPPLAEYLVENAPLGGFATAWCGAAALSAVAAVVFVSLGETRAPLPASQEPALGRQPLIHRGSVPMALGFLASVVAMGGFLAFAGLHAVAVGLSSASLPLVVYGTTVVVGRIAFAKVPDRLPAVPVAAAALAAIAAGLVTMALWSTPLGLVTGTAVLALGVTFTTPAFFSAIFTAAPASERGAASATTSACLDLGLGGGPIVLGVVAQSAGIPWALAAGGLVAVLGSIWTMSLARRVPDSGSPTPGALPRELRPAARMGDDL